MASGPATIVRDNVRFRAQPASHYAVSHVPSSSERLALISSRCRARVGCTRSDGLRATRCKWYISSAFRALHDPFGNSFAYSITDLFFEPCAPKIASRAIARVSADRFCWASHQMPIIPL